MSEQHSKRQESNKELKKYKFTYPHPLLKSQSQTFQTKDKYPYSYSKVKINDLSFPSTQILRCTNHRPKAEFGILLQPFGQLQLPILAAPPCCQQCRTAINSLTKVNAMNFICNMCQHQNYFNAFNFAQYSQISCFNTQIQKDFQQKNICFVLQISEIIKNNNILQILLECLSTLQENVKVGFSFFNQAYIIFINQQLNQVQKISIQDYKDFTNIPIEQCYFYKNCSEITEQTVNILIGILKNQKSIGITPIEEITEFFSKTIKQPLQICYFISKVNKNEQIPFQEHYENIKMKTNKQKTKILTSQFQTRNNMNYFMVIDQPNYEQAVAKLNYNLVKIYSSGSLDLYSSLYYDLYQHFTTSFYFNTILQITVPFHIVLKEIGLQYGNQILQSVKKQKLYAIYTILLKKMHSNTTIPLLFLGQGCHSFMQFRFYNNNSLNKVINYTLGSPNELKKKQFYNNIDDETYFYFLAKGVSTYPHNKIKIELQSCQKRLIKQLKENYDDSGIVFPTSLRHTFLYTYLFQKHISNHTSCVAYFLYTFFTSPIELISKRLYPRVFEMNFQEQTIKNVRFLASKFKTDAITLVQNGLILFVVVGSNVNSNILLTVFGTQQTNDFTNIYQLPILTTNEFVRKAISEIRSRNKSHFLQLKIVDHFSKLFETEIPFCYRKEQHQKYLMKLWKN